jgi:hypothetical protein
MPSQTIVSVPTHLEETNNTPEFIREQVNERGFYLYEWISSDELRMTLEKDYLNIVKWASIPLAIITAIAGFIGFAWGPVGTILAVLLVLWVFYTIIGFILFFRFIHRSYLYTRGANVVITDNHFVSWGNIIEQWDAKSIQENFWRFESIFDEPFLWESKLAEKKAHAKTELFDSLKEIAWGWWKILQNVWRSRDSWGLVVAILIAGFLYASMMGLIYFIGIFFISLFGRLFSWGAHRYLMAMNNTEHKIQTLFSDISDCSDDLRSWQMRTVSLLSDAQANEWQENLSGKLRESFELIGELAGNATNKTIELRKILESSQYKDIFNFVKYGNWVKKQIIEPIESILLLLNKNSATLKKTIQSIESQISTTTDPSLQKPLILQKNRLDMQVESFQRNTDLLSSYREKLIV